MFKDTINVEIPIEHVANVIILSMVSIQNAITKVNHLSQNMFCP
jgi:uncharacterized membrane protein